jgi:hypothetical protein
MWLQITNWAPEVTSGRNRDNSPWKESLWLSFSGQDSSGHKHSVDLPLSFLAAVINHISQQKAYCELGYVEPQKKFSAKLRGTFHRAVLAMVRGQKRTF